MNVCTYIHTYIYIYMYTGGQNTNVADMVFVLNAL